MEKRQKLVMWGIFILSLLLLLTSCRKDGGFDKRSEYITHSLRGKTFTVKRIYGPILSTVPNNMLDLSNAKGTKIKMSFTAGNTSIDFVPPSDTTFRFIYEYYIDPYQRPCKFANFQHFFMSYSANHNLTIGTSEGNPPEMIITQVSATKQNFETLRMEDLNGKYLVIKDYTNGESAFILEKYKGYTAQGNPVGPLLLTIELVSRGE